MPDADKEVLLVIDGTTGQNAISQVKAFKEETDLTGLVITKLDGYSQRWSSNRNSCRKSYSN